jgi:hypothetical protein
MGMAWWGWYLIGGGLGLAQQLVRWARNPQVAQSDITHGHPIQGLLAVFFFGALIFGTLLWVVFGLVLKF